MCLRARSLPRLVSTRRCFGDFGTPSFGYNVKYLLKKITDILHLDEQKHIVWLGAKSLEDNPAMLRDLSRHNCHIVAVLDLDESRIGSRVHDLQTLHMSSLPQVVANLDIDVAILALPPEQAQEGLDALAIAGVKAVLNLTPTILDVPRGVNVRNIDVSGELVALSFYCHRS
jgi:redox-sensing transcriptional repressor